MNALSLQLIRGWMRQSSRPFAEFWVFVAHFVQVAWQNFLTTVVVIVIAKYPIRPTSDNEIKMAADIIIILLRLISIRNRLYNELRVVHKRLCLCRKERNIAEPLVSWNNGLSLTCQQWHRQPFFNLPQPQQHYYYHCIGGPADSEM